MALSFAAFSAPHVTYATCAFSMETPLSKVKRPSAKRWTVLSCACATEARDNTHAMTMRTIERCTRMPGSSHN